MAPKKRRFDDAFFATAPRTTVLRLPPLREQLSASLAQGRSTPVLNDEAGLDAAYASPSGLHLDGAGTLFVAGSRGSLLGKDWRENYLSMGIPLAAQSVGIPLPYSIESNQRYKTLQQYMKDHSGQVKNMVGTARALQSSMCTRTITQTSVARLASTRRPMPIRWARSI
jgi:hypothetical protein